ncbi:MAG: hypothetical protein ACOC56_02170, partial [Atribacterota bacterium]
MKKLCYNCIHYKKFGSKYKCDFHGFFVGKFYFCNEFKYKRKDKNMIEKIVREIEKYLNTKCFISIEPISISKQKRISISFDVNENFNLHLPKDNYFSIDGENKEYLTLWKDGTWNNDIWENGVWKYGTWENGVWKYGTWENGTWKNGVWLDGTWKNGTWKNGTWKNGVWLDGTWKNGTWKNGTWKNGVWKNGVIVTIHGDIKSTKN